MSKAGELWQKMTEEEKAPYTKQQQEDVKR